MSAFRQIPLFPSPRQIEFRRLFYEIGSWNDERLGKLSSLQLQALAFVMYVPKSGTKEVLRARLLAIRDLRMCLSEVKAPEDLVEAYSAKELRTMCATAKIWRSGNKYSCAAGLLNWRNKCRREGQKNLEKLRRKEARS